MKSAMSFRATTKNASRARWVRKARSQLVGALLGSRYGEGAANAAMQGGSVLAQTGFLLPGSREQESEAGRLSGSNSWRRQASIPVAPWCCGRT
jgi:hypothetical protein